MFDTLLIATDGSDCAARAARYGLELATLYDADVEFVHVLSKETDRLASERGTDPDAVAETVLSELQELAADAGIDSETHLLHGQPATAITEHAAAGSYDVIVMGRRGRSGLGERLLGTVTDRVLRQTDRPVLTVPEGAGPVAYDTLLLPTDGSENAERAVPVAGDIAAHAAATLHILSVVDATGEAGIFDAGGISKEYLARLTATAEEAVDAATKQVGDVDTVSTVRTGVPHEEIGDYADEHAVDLVVMATRGRTNLTGQYLGGTTNRVLRTVDVPVLVVR